MMAAGWFFLVPIDITTAQGVRGMVVATINQG